MTGSPTEDLHLIYNAPMLGAHNGVEPTRSSVAICHADFLRGRLTLER
jgi:hypothetical protein